MRAEAVRIARLVPDEMTISRERELAETIDAAISAAVAEEREAICARIESEARAAFTLADLGGWTVGTALVALASAIREGRT